MTVNRTTDHADGVAQHVQEIREFLTSDSTISLFFPVMANTANASDGLPAMSLTSLPSCPMVGSA